MLAVRCLMLLCIGFVGQSVVLVRMQPVLGLQVLWGVRLLIFHHSGVSIRPSICWQLGLGSRLSETSRLLQSAWLMSWSMQLKGPPTGIEHGLFFFVLFFDFWACFSLIGLICFYLVCGLCSWWMSCVQLCYKEEGRDWKSCQGQSLTFWGEQWCNKGRVLFAFFLYALFRHVYWD